MKPRSDAAVGEIFREGICQCLIWVGSQPCLEQDVGLADLQCFLPYIFRDANTGSYGIKSQEVDSAFCWASKAVTLVTAWGPLSQIPEWTPHSVCSQPGAGAVGLLTSSRDTGTREDQGRGGFEPSSSTCRLGELRVLGTSGTQTSTTVLKKDVQPRILGSTTCSGFWLPKACCFPKLCTNLLKPH